MANSRSPSKQRLKFAQSIKNQLFMKKVAKTFGGFAE